MAESRGIMDLFWKLAEPEDQIREDAVVDLLCHLLKAQQTCEKGICSDLDYTLNRLIGGLASSRKAARLGFFVALVELLKRFHSVVSVDQIIVKIEQQGFNDQKNQMTKADSIGYCLALGSLVRSGIVNTDSDIVIKVLEEFIIRCCEEKNLAQLYAQFAIEIISNVKPQIFHQKVWPRIKCNFETGWKSYSPNLLWILLYILKHLPDSVKQAFLSKNFGMKNILTEEGLAKATAVLLEAPTLHVHPLFGGLLESVMSTDKFEYFWNCIISGTIGSLKKERTSIALKLVQFSIPCLATAFQVKVILCPQIIDQLMRNLCDKSKLLHAASVQLVSFLIKYVKDCQKSDFQFAILLCFITKPSSILFDEVTRTRTLYQLISELDAEASLKSREHLKKMFYEAENDENDRIRANILKYMSYHLQTQNHEDTRHNVDVLQFLILHAYFKQVGLSNKIPQCDKILNVASNANLHKVSRESLHRGLITILKKIPIRNSQNALQIYCRTIADIFQYTELLFKHSKVVVPVTSNIEKKFIKKLLSQIEVMDKIVGDKSELIVAFQLLAVHVGFLLMDDNTKLNLLEDVFSCHENALVVKNDNLDDESSWIRVLVDVLLAILSEDSQLLSVVSSHVFTLILPHLTVKALEHILDVIDPSRGGNEILGEESGDEESGSDDSNMENGENEEVDENFRASIKEALGDAADNSDSESEVYLEDDDMFKLDDKLAQAFQMMTRKRPLQNKGEEALLGFRIRCMDFINAIVKSLPKITFLMPCLVSLTNVIDNGMRTKNQNQLTTRAMTSVNNIIGTKKFHLEVGINVDLLPAVLNEVAKKLKVTSLASQVCSFVIRCAMFCDKSSGQETGKKSSTYTDSCILVYQEWLREFFIKKNSFIRPQLFTVTARKNFVCGWQFVDVLLEFSFNNEVRLFQRKHGITLLKLLTSKQLFVSNLVNENEWRTFSDTCYKKSEILEDVLQTEVNRSYCLEVLSLLQNIVRLDKKYFKKVEFSSRLREILSESETYPGHIAKEIKKLLSSMPAGESSN